MQYDGGGKLGEALAALCGFSPKNQNAVAARIKEAKAALGIQCINNNIPDDVKLALWQWHYDRLNPVQDVKQGGSVQDSPVQSLHNAIVQDVKQADDGGVYNVKQNGDSAVYNVKQSDDFSQAHFAVTVAGKRTTVMLEGYLVKALQRKHGLPDNAAVRAWIGQAIKADGVRFDSHAPLTRQVKRLAVESLV